MPQQETQGSYEQRIHRQRKEDTVFIRGAIRDVLRAYHAKHGDWPATEESAAFAAFLNTHKYDLRIDTRMQRQNMSPGDVAPMAREIIEELTQEEMPKTQLAA